MQTMIQANRYRKKYWLLALAAMLVSVPAVAQTEETPIQKICTTEDRACILDQLEQLAPTIDQVAWRDQTYRELAKTRAFERDINGSVRLIDKIETPDTKAMTIRGIGMTVAEQGYADLYETTFRSLRAEAEKITHAPSYAIALTYIAMAQAFANDDEGAWKTAADMKNPALRHKAYGETAEIQAEHGDFKSAMKSIGLIESEAYRNKAYVTVSQILAEYGLIAEAYDAAQEITNPYQKAAAIQKVLDIQKPREAEKQ